MFEVQGVVNEFPVGFGSLGNPQFSSFVVHGCKDLGHNRVRGGRCGDLLSEGRINCTEVILLVASL